MHIKKRGNTLSLYRSVWVPKGSCGNTHGFAQQKFVASLADGATSIPANVRGRLSSEEAAFVEHRICSPARVAFNETQAAAIKREADPLWRINEAVRLLEEAAGKSSEALVPQASVARAVSAAEKIQIIGHQGALSRQTGPLTDTLRDAVVALKASAQAVKSGRYGNGPSEGMKSTPVYALWLELQEALEGSNEDSLMRCLQARGFVKTRVR